MSAEEVAAVEGDAPPAKRQRADEAEKKEGDEEKKEEAQNGEKKKEEKKESEADIALKKKTEVVKEELETLRKERNELREAQKAAKATETPSIQLPAGRGRGKGGVKGGKGAVRPAGRGASLGFTPTAEQEEKLQAAEQVLEDEWDEVDEGRTEAEILADEPERSKRREEAREALLKGWREAAKRRGETEKLVRAEVDKPLLEQLTKEADGMREKMKEMSTSANTARTEAQKLRRELLTQRAASVLESTRQKTAALRSDMRRLVEIDERAEKNHVARLATLKKKVETLEAKTEEGDEEDRQLREDALRLRGEVQAKDADLRAKRLEAGRLRARRPPGAAPPKWSIGQKIMADYGGEWHNATIRSVDHAKKTVDVDWGAEATFTNGIAFASIKVAPKVS